VRPQLTLTLLLCLLSAPTALAQDAMPARDALPGSYVTVVFPVDVDGETLLEPEGPPNWTLVTSPRRTSVKGRLLVPVTMRVPPGAAAGGRFEVRLNLRQSGGDRVKVGEVRVLAQAGFALVAPKSVQGNVRGASRAPLSFELEVQNTGNAPDTARISTTGTTWPVVLEPSEIALGAGERGRVRVTVLPEGVLIGRAPTILWLRATSVAGPATVVTRRVTLEFNGSRTDSDASSDAPQLRFGVLLGAGLDLNWRGAASGNAPFSAAWRYSVAPSLRGALSQTVAGEVSSTPLEGDTQTPFSGLPRVRLGLSGNSWSASMGLAQGDYDLSGSFRALDWTVGLGAALGLSQTQGRYGLSALGTREDARTALGLSARTLGSALWNGEGSTRTDELRARYRFPLLGGETELGGTLSGVQGPGGYQLGWGAAQSFRWRDEGFDLTQSLSGSGSGQTLALLGGTRTLTPFGVRGSSVLSITPSVMGVVTRWKNSLTLLSNPLPGVTLNFAGLLETGAGLRWSVSPSFGAKVSLGDLQLDLGAGYQHDEAQADGDSPARSSDHYRAGLGVVQGPFVAQAKLDFETRREGELFEQSLGTNVEARYALSSRSLLKLAYTLDGRVLDGQANTFQHVLSAGWQQYWTPRLSSEVSYSHSFGDREGSDRLGVNLGVLELWPEVLPGLSGSVGYSYGGTNLFGGDFTNGEHRLSLRLGLDLDYGVNTPEALVNAFGGQAKGEVRGVAFTDRNRDGAFDEGDLPQPNLRFTLGKYPVTTDAAGRYRLSLPAGRYRLLLTSDLSATLHLADSSELDITAGERLERPLVLLEDVPLSLSLFEDANHNGLRDPQEEGIAYGSILLEGAALGGSGNASALRRSLKMGADGNLVGAQLPPGNYTLRPDPDGLPADFQASGEAVSRTLTLGQRPEPVLLGAALPQKTVSSTYSGGELALFARLLEDSAPPGAEVRVEVWAQGADRVEVELGGVRSSLELEGGDKPGDPAGHFVGWLNVPLEASGPQSVAVRATALGRTSEQTLTLSVRPGPLFDTDSELLEANLSEVLDLALSTRFRAQTLRLELPDGREIALESPDGRRWSGRLESKVPLEGEVKVIAGEELLGTLRVRVR